MTEIEITTASVKGQVVIPKSIREELGITPGTKLAAYGRKDVIILKKLTVPAVEEFERIVDFGVGFAKKKGIKTRKDMRRILKS